MDLGRRHLLPSILGKLIRLESKTPIDLILNHLDFTSLQKLRKVHPVIRGYIDRSQPDFELQQIHCELGEKEIKLTLQRDQRLHTERDPFDVEIKYIQDEQKVCRVARNGGIEHTLTNSDIFEFAIADLKYFLKAQHSLVHHFMITVHQSLSWHFNDKVRKFLNKLEFALVHRTTPLKVHMLHAVIPPDEELVMTIFPRLDVNSINSLQIDNVDTNARDTVIELTRVLNTQQWNRLQYICVNLGFQVSSFYNRFEHIPVQRVQHHPESIEEYRQALRMIDDLQVRRMLRNHNGRLELANLQ